MTQAVQTLRNIGIIAHIDAGKTTLTERMLFYTQKIHRMGEVHNGTATMDYLPEEQERGITITSACTTCQWLWKNTAYSVNIIDTPGHVDFTMEVERCLRVLDGAVGVFCAVGGVEPQSETVWRQSESFGVPKVAFINKVDRAGADVESVLEAMRQRLRIQPVLLTMPLGQGEDFTALLDIVTEERLDFSADDQGRTITRAPLSTDEAALVAPWRERLLEHIAEHDEAFLERYLEGDSFVAEDIIAVLRKATLERHVTPVLCGSALRNVGVQNVLDAVASLLPSPADRPPAVASIPIATGADTHDAHNDSIFIDADSDAPLAALVFKVLMDGGRKLAFLRIYAGTLQEGGTCYNVYEQCEDRVQRLYRLHADHREQLDVAGAGDIVAVVGLRSAQTGQTYVHKQRLVQLESIDTYEPVMTLALEPHNADEGKALDDALERYTTEDPTLKVRVDEGSGHRMLSGMGELHLDVILERMQREYGIRPRSGQPQVLCRETIMASASADGLFDKELGKEYHFGRVSISMEPLARGAGNEIIFGEFLPPEAVTDARESAKIGINKVWIDATLQGIEDALQSGPCLGYAVQDVRVCVMHLEKKEGASSAPGYHMAAGMAVRDALAKASPVLLEPIMLVEISVPEEHVGAVINLFSTRGGRVEHIDDKGLMGKSIQGLAPLSKLFGFATALRSVSQGRAGLVMQFSAFDAV